jgi:hypothetical protein
MMVQFSVVGREKPMSMAIHMDAVPRVGETVTLPGLEDRLQHVRTVVWYPVGDPPSMENSHFGREGGFVYVVLGPSRPCTDS